MSEKLLGLVDFGKALLKTCDLDPIYIIANRKTLPEDQLKRWLLAYWWFYQASVASYLSETMGKNFYQEADKLARPEAKTPRGTERRHFRGQAALDSIESFRQKFRHPEGAVDRLIYKADGEFSKLQEYVVARWRLFGPWISFKQADMLERCMSIPMKFESSQLAFYDSPQKGAKEYCESRGLDFDELKLVGVIKKLEMKFRNYMAPPLYDRAVNLQEIETCLCKWHSYRGNHYWVGKDLLEISHALESGRKTKTARKLLELMPPRVPR